MKINPYISYVFLYTISAVAFVIKNGDVAPLTWPSREGIRIPGLPGAQPHPSDTVPGNVSVANYYMV